MPLVKLVKKRHLEMVERRSRILKTSLKKQKMMPEEIQIQLEKSDASREKIVNKISS